MRLSDESTAKFEIELVNKQVQKIKQAKKIVKHIMANNLDVVPVKHCNYACGLMNWSIQ